MRDPQYDRSEFHRKFVEGIQEKGISDREITDHWGISLPSLQRWKDGRNAPVPRFQKLVLDWIEDYEHPDSED